MDDQATMSSRSNGNANGESVLGGIAGFSSDVMSLAELQAKLAALDLKESAARAAVPLALGSAGLGLALGSVPVFLAGAALLLAPVLKISIGLALLLAAAAAIVLALVLGGLAVIGLRHSFDSFRRSREELNRNVSWIRTVLVQSGRGVPRRLS
jgi:uncharacterized membrane protein YqjE